MMFYLQYCCEHCAQYMIGKRCYEECSHCDCWCDDFDDEDNLNNENRKDDKDEND